MQKTLIFLAICLMLPPLNLCPEEFRTTVEASIEITPERAAEGPVTIGINSSLLINLGPEARFLRGIELEIASPQRWMSYSNSLVMIMYNNLSPQTVSGVADMEGDRIAFAPLPSRMRIVYHIPVRAQHELRTTTTVIVPSGIIQHGSFPILFRLMPVAKGLDDVFEQLTFNVTARPIIGSEGAVRLIPRYPPQLRNRPFTVLIDDNVINNTSEEILLREGEHHLVVLSDDYRNESRRFVVERARVLDLIIELQDPTPVVIFESPQNARIFLNNVQISTNSVTVEPGTHEIRFQIGDYTITRSITVQRGKTYRVSVDIDLSIQEDE